MQQYDYLIIGAGPAGLQLGYYLETANRNYLILETGDSPGTFFKKFPRHRKLISINKVYTGFDDPELNLRWDWNSLLSDDDQMLLKKYSRRYFPTPEDLTNYLADYAKRFNLNIKYGAKIEKIYKDEGFHLTDSNGEVYHGKRVIVAAGVTKPYIPPIPGIELVDNYTEVSVDPDEFTNKRVLILGKGNSAFETAENLIETAAVLHLASPGRVKLAWKSHYVGHLRAVNNNFLDTYLLKSQNGLLDATVDRIERRDGKFVVHFTYLRTQGAAVDVEYDRVIACTGFRFDNSVFDESCRPAMVINERFPDQTYEWESTNVEDLYFAGTLMQMRDFKKTTSGFIHGFRYNVRALFHILERKYFNNELPSRPISATAEGMADAVIERINRTSALWQQNGFLGDLIVVADDGESAQYYEDLPVDYIRNSECGQHGHYYVVTLEYGPDDPDYPFDFIRYTEPEEANLNPQLHPVIRRFDRGHLVSEHHILEDLEGRWINDIYTDPVPDFFRAQFAMSEA